MKTSFKKLLSRILGIGFVLLLATFVIWRIWLNHAINSQFQAIRAAGFPANPAELNDFYPAVRVQENAADVMSRAFDLLQDFPDQRKIRVEALFSAFRMPPFSPEDVRLMEAYFAMNSNSLAIMELALQHPRCRYPVDLSVGPVAPMPHLQKLKQLAHLCQLRARFALVRHLPDEADASTADILGLARTLETEPVLISQLVRLAILRIGLETLEERLNEGEPSERELVGLGKTLSQLNETSGIAYGLIGERASLVDCIRDPISFERKHPEFLDEEDGQKTPPQGNWFLPITTGLMDRDLLFYLKAMDSNIALAGLTPPYNCAYKTNAEAMASLASRHYCIMSAMMLPALAWGDKSENRYFASLRLDKTAIAIERFRLAQGRLPKRLDELCPEFLNAVPVDPFDGQPLRYHLLEKGYVVYSIDEDGHDNGGREMPNRINSSNHGEYDITFTVKR